MKLIFSDLDRPLLIGLYGPQMFIENGDGNFRRTKSCWKLEYSLIVLKQTVSLLCLGKIFLCHRWALKLHAAFRWTSYSKSGQRSPKQLIFFVKSPHYIFSEHILTNQRNWSLCFLIFGPKYLHRASLIPVGLWYKWEINPTASITPKSGWLRKIII